MKKTVRWMTILGMTAYLLIAPFPRAYTGTCAAESADGFRTMLHDRILEVLDSWPAEDQYAVMFFIYPNAYNQYGGYANLPEFSMLYKCESDMGQNPNPYFSASDGDEERWNPAFWDCSQQRQVIGFDAPNPVADGLIGWYESTGVQNIEKEDADSSYDGNMQYIGNGPNGLPELLQLVTGIARELQSNGTIEAKFGRRIPIILADFECTWYMVKATREANPDGEADAYIDACLRRHWVEEDRIQ